ncbi:MAG: hypothetical protein ACOCSR_04345, partial [Wenzhouxiangella sp.]
CHALFLDVPTPPEWEIYVSMDSVIKALHPDLDEVGHCFFHADYHTFFHLLDGPVEPRELAPFQPLVFDDAPLDPVTIGDMTTVYLRHPERLDSDAIESLVVLRHEAGTFNPSTVRPGEWPIAQDSGQRSGQ